MNFLKFFFNNFFNSTSGRRSVPEIKIEKNSKQIPAQDFIENYFNLDTNTKLEIMESSISKVGSFGSMMGISNQLKTTSSSGNIKGFKSGFNVDDTDFKF